ncbi:MAG: putative amino acid transporter [Frankiales bacterium]|nr:putative amino acid transporter [Frankiales bacterium]
MQRHTSVARPAAWTRRALPAAALAMTLAASLSACGNDDSKKSSPSPVGTPAADSALGSVNEAKGEPVKIGFVADGQSAAIDTTDEIKAAQAVETYANKYLGGINGRPLQFVTCQTKSTPAGAADCGQQFVSAKVLAVNAGSPGTIAPVVTAVTAAGIPTFANVSFDPSVLQEPNLVWGNPLGNFGSAAAFARDKGAKKAALIVIDVPAATGPAKQLAPLLYKNAGASVEVIGIAPGTADMTPQVKAADAKGVDIYHIIGNPSFCTSAIKAIKTLGLKVNVSAIDRCIDETGTASIPNGYEGITITGQANLDPTTDDYKLYAAVLKNAGMKDSGNATSGYEAALGLVRALNAAKVTDYTSAGLLAAIKSAPATPYPLGNGATMKCDGTAVPISKSICSTFGVVGDGQKDGTVKNYRTLDTASIYKFG